MFRIEHARNAALTCRASATRAPIAAPAQRSTLSGAKCPRVAASRVDDDFVILLAQLLHFLSDGRPIEPDRREGGRLRIGLSADLGEGRRAGLFVGVDYENIAPAPRENGSDVHREQAFADAAFDVRDRKNHADTEV